MAFQFYSYGGSDGINTKWGECSIYAEYQDYFLGEGKSTIIALQMINKAFDVSHCIFTYIPVMVVYSESASMKANCEVYCSHQQQAFLVWTPLSAMVGTSHPLFAYLNPGEPGPRIVHFWRLRAR